MINYILDYITDTFLLVKSEFEFIFNILKNSKLIFINIKVLFTEKRYFLIIANIISIIIILSLFLKLGIYIFIGYLLLKAYLFVLIEEIEDIKEFIFNDIFNTIKLFFYILIIIVAYIFITNLDNIIETILTSYYFGLFILILIAYFTISSNDNSNLNENKHNLKGYNKNNQVIVKKTKEELKREREIKKINKIRKSVFRSAKWTKSAYIRSWKLVCYSCWMVWDVRCNNCWKPNKKHKRWWRCSYCKMPIHILKCSSCWNTYNLK